MITDLMMADHLPAPPTELAVNMERIRRFQWLSCCIGNTAPELEAESPDAQAVEYVRATIDNSWLRWVLKEYASVAWDPLWTVSPTRFVDVYSQGFRDALKIALTNWCALDKLDGVMIDTPLESVANETALAQLFGEVAAAMEPRELCLNFGDLGTWATKRALGDAVPCHFVQVAANAGAFSLSAFSQASMETRRRLDQGKTIVLGVWDPQRRNEKRANDIVRAFKGVDGLFMHYNSALTTERPSVDAQWSKLFEVAP